jgi:hypothetical protein
MTRRRRRAFRPTIDILDDRRLLSGLVPAQVTRAYGLDSIAFSVNGQAIRGDGTGQTIAIVDAYHNPYLISDLQTFNRAYNLPDPVLHQVNLAGDRTHDGWASEEVMDVQWAHAIAPGATIVVVEARSDGLQDMLAAVDVARSIPGVSVISMSWGMGEFRGQNPLEGHFTTPAGHTGITFIAASGDDGRAAGPIWPSSSSNVLAVGGTALAATGDGTYLGETVWVGSGGGTSRFEARPSYQRGGKPAGRRTTPDVSFVGDPYTGVSVYFTAPSTGQGSWIVAGGTSLGAPAWAAIVAIANQGRALAGLAPLDGASQTLPTLYALPQSSFRPVATPPSGGRTGTLAYASPGLGSPNGAALVNGLAFGAGPSINARTNRRRRLAAPRQVARQTVETSPARAAFEAVAPREGQGTPGLSTPAGGPVARPRSRVAMPSRAFGLTSQLLDA